MKFEAKHFVKCRFNPLDDNSMDALYNELSMHVPAPTSSATRLLRYIVLMYDDNSPLTQYETNIIRRKILAAELAGFVPLADYATELESIYDLSMPGILDLVNKYLFNYCKQRTWIKIVVNEQLFEEYSKRLMQPVASAGASADDVTTVLGKNGEKDELQAYQIKAKLREELDAIGESLEKYYREINQVDEQLTKKTRKSYTPEGMAD